MRPCPKVINTAVRLLVPVFTAVLSPQYAVYGKRVVLVLAEYILQAVVAPVFTAWVGRCR